MEKNNDCNIELKRKKELLKLDAMIKSMKNYNNISLDFKTLKYEYDLIKKGSITQ